jgi:hypothetical protein
MYGPFKSILYPAFGSVMYFEISNPTKNNKRINKTQNADNW